MSLEGGNFKCYVDGFETNSVKEWNAHCPGHIFEEGSTRCRTCDKEIKFKNLPFHPFDELGHKNISLECPDCKQNQSDVEVQYA